MADREWELEEDIPQVEDPFIQKYLSGRDALVAEEHKKRHGQSDQANIILNRTNRIRL